MIRAARLIRAGLAAGLLALLPMVLVCASAQPLAAQTNGAEVSGPDYDAWEASAMRAEALVADAETTDEQLMAVRGQLVDWRAAFLVAQSANSTRIATLRTQIDALGPAPVEGQGEAVEISARRTELTDQLTRLQAPGIAADEAYRRADGLIKEIDRLLRERQADELLRLWPSPLNPANWPAGIKAISDLGAKLGTEVQSHWDRASSRERLRGNLPLILLLTAVAAGLVLRGRRSMDALSRWVSARSSPRWRKVWSLPISLGQIVLPTGGLYLLAEALMATSMLGPTGVQIVEVIPALGLIVTTANWIASRVFPRTDDIEAPLNLPPLRRAEGRFHVKVFGGLIAIGVLTDLAREAVGAGDAAIAVLSFPVLVVAGLLLFRMGNLLRAHSVNDTAPGDQVGFRNRLIALVGRAAEVIGAIGPVLAAIGYIAAAESLVYPAAVSLGLLGALFLLQQMVNAVWALLARRDDGVGDALAPTLIGFALALATLPLFAMIWGARPSDIAELWRLFLAGFAIGETQIAPTNFLVFAVIFGIGYTVTRLFQGALRSSILPKTSLDLGGQNAVLSGVGYLGVFLAGLIAINAAGINLAGLAIVAGALSVGIGFGLQNIVSNFVSGIILLIERPVSEGDWIEVGGVQGVVKTISVRSTRIQTFDRTDVIVPNTDLIAGRVTNWTRYNLTGRLIVPVAVAVGSDTRKVERVLLDIAEAEPLAVLNPPPQVVLMGFTPDAIQFEVRLILRDVNFQVSVRSEMNHAILRRFAEEDIFLSLSLSALAQTSAQKDRGGETG
jgi:potassium-dependent mechanosensitive channel